MGLESYIMDIRTLERLTFLYFEGDGDISDDSPPEYTSTSIIGRSSGIPAYKGTGSRKISFSLRLIASAEQGEIPRSRSDANDDNFARMPFDPAFPNAFRQDSSIHRKVYNDVNFLKSFLYPQYSTSSGNKNGLVFPPPVAFLSIGSFIKAKAIMTSCPVTWKKPWVGPEGVSFPLMADVSLDFEILVDNPFGSQDIRLGRNRISSNR